MLLISYSKEDKGDDGKRQTMYDKWREKTMRVEYRYRWTSLDLIIIYGLILRVVCLWFNSITYCFQLEGVRYRFINGEKVQVKSIYIFCLCTFVLAITILSNCNHFFLPINTYDIYIYNMLCLLIGII